MAQLEHGLKGTIMCFSSSLASRLPMPSYRILLADKKVANGRDTISMPEALLRGNLALVSVAGDIEWVTLAPRWRCF